MSSKRVIPFLMLRDELLFKSKQFSSFCYIGDPLVAVKIFNEKEAQEICIVDIDPQRTNKPINFKLLKEIAAECFMPLSYGGGIKTLEDIRKVLYAGYEKVVLNSILHENPIFLGEAVKEFGSSTIICGIDYKAENSKYPIYFKNGTQKSDKNVITFSKDLEEQGAGELFINNITRDGSMDGMNLEILKNVCEEVNIPIIAAGGIGSLKDIKDGFSTGVNGIAVGSLFVYKGNLNAVLINYPDSIVLQNLMS